MRVRRPLQRGFAFGYGPGMRPLELIALLPLLVVGPLGCGDDSDDSEGPSATPMCVPAHRAMTLAIVGNQRCAAQEQCIEDSCSAELRATVGAGWESGDYVGGVCGQYVDCVAACDCEADCSLSCREMHANGGACLESIITIAECRNGACPSASESCVDY